MSDRRHGSIYFPHVPQCPLSVGVRRQFIAGGPPLGDYPAQDPDGFSRKLDFDRVASVTEDVATTADYFSPDSAIKRGWARICAVTPDHHPIIGGVLPGFMNAIGFSCHGFMQSPAVGQVVARIVADSALPPVNVSSLSTD